ncbi:MAG: tetratricopeptide repeat protein [Anaerolineales bacterium]|nr:tetratricopeptide repeat protein [Anaerolineales bacterium]
MQSKIKPDEIVAEGKTAFEKGEFEAAVKAFSVSIDVYEANGDNLNVAEMKNNLSVALLKCGRPKEALNAVAGTVEMFALSGDIRRQAMAIGNRAAALEALGKTEEAISDYKHSAELFAQAGEGDLQSVVLKSAAAIELKRCHLSEAAVTMLGSLESVKKPSLLQRLMKLLLRLKP